MLDGTPPDRGTVVIGLISGSYERRVILPVALIVAAATLTLLALVLWTAREHNQIARAGETRLLTTALASELRRVDERLFDYAFWDDAYERAHLAYDVEWAQHNLLVGAEGRPGLALTAVIDAEGKPWFVARDRTRSALDLADALDPSSREALERLRLDADDALVTQFGLFEGRLALVAAGPISPHGSGRSREPGPRSVLLQVELFDTAHLRRIAETYGLDDLRLRAASPAGTLASGDDDKARQLLPAGDGTALAELAWRPQRPGDELLLRFLPVLGISLASLAVFVGVVLRNARISAQALRESEARALRDPLTDLANRRLFGDLLTRALARAVREGDLVAVQCLDLDGFKQINDRYGHEVGDLVLREIASRLTGLVRETDCVARLGGDEFAILQVGIADAPAAIQLAERAADAIARPVVVQGLDLQLGASIGIALGPIQARRAGELVRLADAAMYEAKRAGKGGWRLAAPGAAGVAEADPTQSHSGSVSTSSEAART